MKPDSAATDARRRTRHARDARSAPLPLPAPRAGAARAELAWLTVAVCAAVLVVHWPAIHSRALAFDDTQYLTENPLVQNPGWRSAWRFLSEILAPSTVEGYYQPLTMISLMVTYAVGGRPESLLPFHLTNLVHHVLNTMLVLLLLHRLFGSARAAAVAALLFGLHPLSVEVIPWVSERKGTLSAMFGFLCLLFYVEYARRPHWGRYAGVAGFYLLGLLSKPTVVPIPLVLLAMDFWPLGRLGRRAVLEKVPLLALAAVSALVTFRSQAQTSAAFVPDATSWTRIPLILCHNVAFYLNKIVWPADLSSHYPVPEPLGLAQPMVLEGVIGTPLLVGLLLLSLRWTRAIATGCLIFFVAIFPTMGVIGFTNAIACDKYVYFPAVGLLMTLTWALASFIERPAPPTQARARLAVVAALAAAVGLAQAAGVRGYLHHWRDTEAFCRRILQFAPDAMVAHNELAIELGKQGRLEEALPHAARAVALAPNYHKARYNFGLALALSGRVPEAVEQFREAARLRPTFALAHNNLGYGLLLLGRPAEAVPHLERAAELLPAEPSVFVTLGDAYAAVERRDDAERAFQAALRIDPDDAAARERLARIRP